MGTRLNLQCEADTKNNKDEMNWNDRSA